MEKSESIKALAKALCKFQNEVGTIPKSATNPFFNSKYADLSDILSTIKEPLHNAGLSVSQFPTGEHTLTTILMHDSGEFIQSAYSMKPKKDDPQGLGSVITYQRRYALGAVLGLNIDEDDDANAASETKPTKTNSKVAAGPEMQPLDLLTVLDGIDLINAASDIKKLIHVWNTCTSLHPNKNFVEAMTARKKELSTPQPEPPSKIRSKDYEEAHAIQMVKSQGTIEQLTELTEGEERDAVTAASAKKGFELGKKDNNG